MLFIGISAKPERRLNWVTRLDRDETINLGLLFLAASSLIPFFISELVNIFIFLSA
jgi:hypothetical protein